jgi:ribose transport system substrate-binding protein
MKTKILIMMMVLISTTMIASHTIAGSPHPFVQPGDKTVTIGVVVPAPDHPWLAENAKAARKAAEMLGPTCEVIVLDRSSDAASQINDVESLLIKKVDGIVLLAVEGGPLTPICARVRRAGIPLASVSRLIESNDYSVKVEGDNVLIGYMAGEYIAKRLNGKGLVAELIGIPGLTDTVERAEGFRKALERYPGIKIIASLPGYFVVEKGMTAMEDILTAHKRIDAVWSHNDAMAIGADKAIKARGRTEEMFVIGADGNREMFKLIKSGTSPCQASILYPPQMTGDAVLLIYLATQGRGIPGFFDKEIPVHFKIKTSLVTKENIEEFWDMSF